MKRLLTSMALALVLLAGLAGSAFASDGGDGDVKTKFYNFDDMLIDGGVKKPTGTLIDVRDRVRFERLLRLNKSFIPELEKSSKEQVLK